MPPNPSRQLGRETLSLHESAEFPTSVKDVVAMFVRVAHIPTSLYE
jgi:hypothetical protein